MAKYVQVRYSPQGNFSKAIKHNLRKNKPSYLRSDMYHNRFKNVYKSSDDDFKKAREKEEEFRQLYKKRVGRFPQRGNASPFFEAIITLSNTINDELENGEVTYKQLNELFTKAVESQLDDIAIMTGTRPELLHYAIHYDETTPHIHFFCTNYDKKGRSLFKKFQTKEKLSNLQTTVGISFMDIYYERGVKKETTMSKHKNIRQMHQAEIKELKEEIKRLQEFKKELKANTENKQELKKQLDEVDVLIREIRKNMKRHRN